MAVPLSLSMSVSSGRWIVRVLGVMILGAMVWWLWPASDETLLRRQLAQIEKWSSYGADEVPLRKLEAVGRLKKMLHAGITLRLNMQGRAAVERSGRESLMEAVQAVRFQIQSMQLDFLEPRFEWSSDKKSVQVFTVLKARLGEDPEQFLELRLDWVKQDGDWWLKRIETVKTWGR